MFFMNASKGFYCEVYLEFFVITLELVVCQAELLFLVFQLPDQRLLLVDVVPELVNLFLVSLAVLSNKNKPNYIMCCNVSPLNLF